MGYTKTVSSISILQTKTPRLGRNPLHLDGWALLPSPSFLGPFTTLVGFLDFKGGGVILILYLGWWLQLATHIFFYSSSSENWGRWNQFFQVGWNHQPGIYEYIETERERERAFEVIMFRYSLHHTLYIIVLLVWGWKDMIIPTKQFASNFKKNPLYSSRKSRAIAPVTHLFLPIYQGPHNSTTKTGSGGPPCMICRISFCWWKQPCTTMDV